MALPMALATNQKVGCSNHSGRTKTFSSIYLRDTSGSQAAFLSFYLRGVARFHNPVAVGAAGGHIFRFSWFTRSSSHPSELCIIETTIVPRSRCPPGRPAQPLRSIFPSLPGAKQAPRMGTLLEWESYRHEEEQLSKVDRKVDRDFLSGSPRKHTAYASGVLIGDGFLHGLLTSCSMCCWAAWCWRLRFSLRSATEGI